MDDYVIGLDIGSQGLKALLLTTEGRISGEAKADYGIDYPHPTWAEQPAAHWLDAISIAIKALLHDTNMKPDQVRAIGLTAQVDGVVPIDRNDQPLRSAIIWMDRRAVAECDEVAAHYGSQDLYHQSGLNLDPTHVAPKIKWLATHEPDIYDRAKYFLLPCSYVAYYLTGELGVDYSNASSTLLMDVSTRQWSPELCRLFDISVDRLTPIHPANSVIGTLRAEAATQLGLRAGIPVTVGSGDEHAACLGAGIVSAGLACDIAGTAEPVCAASLQPLFDSSGLVETHSHADPDLWLLENPGFVSGANLRWFRDQFASPEVQNALMQHVDPYDVLTQAAEGVSPGSEGVIMLPCLMGAMAPAWNSSARGVFFGFTLAHRREHFIRAVMEASAYAVRDITDRMKAIGLELTQIRAVGGGARSKLWRQIKADVTGLPVALLETVETTALGAAMLALSAVGACDSLSQAADQVVHVVEVRDPHPENQRRYQDYYQLYRSTYFALVPVFDQLAETSHLP